MKKLSKQTQIRLLRTITHIGAWIPLALLLWDYQTNNLGADPVREITLRTGKTTLILLLMSLACTPFSILGWKQATTVRRALGKVITQPVIYGAILAVLLLFRLKPVKTRVGRWQREVRHRLGQRFQSAA